MRVVILFINIGHYHAVRIAAAKAACSRRGWDVVAIQVTGNTLRHPWGMLPPEVGASTITLDPNTRSGVNPEGQIPRVGNRRLAESLRSLKPDVIFLPGWGYEICIQCLKWCRRNGVKAVVMSESKADDEPRFWIKDWYKRRLIRQFCAAVVGGIAHVEYAAFLGIKRDAIFTGYDVVDNDYFENGSRVARAYADERRREIPEIPKRPYFIAVTRMVARKNLIALIRAYAKYHANGGRGTNKWDLVICGNGPQANELRTEIVNHRLEGQISLPGFRPYGEIPTWLGLAEAFVHPALQEPWGLALNEACAAGLPVIVSCTAGAGNDLVSSGVNGYFCNPLDIEDMADKLSCIASTDTNARAEMGRQSQLLVKRLPPERFGEAVVKAIEAANNIPT